MKWGQNMNKGQRLEIRWFYCFHLASHPIMTGTLPSWWWIQKVPWSPLTPPCPSTLQGDTQMSLHPWKLKITTKTFLSSCMNNNDCTSDFLAALCTKWSRCQLVKSEVNCLFVRHSTNTHINSTSTVIPVVDQVISAHIDWSGLCLCLQTRRTCFRTSCPRWLSSSAGNPLRCLCYGWSLPLPHPHT